MRVERITVEELKAMMDRGDDVLVLDTRSQGAYAQSDVRIPGSIRVDVSEIDSRAAEFDRARTVVAYCT